MKCEASWLSAGCKNADNEDVTRCLKPGASISIWFSPLYPIFAGQILEPELRYTFALSLNALLTKNIARAKAPESFDRINLPATPRWYGSAWS